MQTKLSIKSDKSPGVLARIVVALHRVHLNLTQQQRAEAEDHTAITQMVEGPAMPQGELVKILTAIPGVLELLSDVQPQAAEASQGSSGAAATESSGPTRAAGESRAVAIAGAFPNILDLVNSYRDTLAPDQAPELMFALGVEVAALRAESLEPVEDGVAIDRFAALRLMPDIAGLADAEYSDEGLKVLSSVFSKPQKGQKASGFGLRFGNVDAVEKCDFLSGYIQGVLEVTPGMQYVHVEETMCRKEGQPYCLFHFDEN